MKNISTLLIGIVIAAFVFSAGSAKANVYATNIKFNGGTNNVTLAGGNVQISYILNEAATAGVSLEIFSGTTVVRTISIASGNPGTVRGTNSVSWDGKNGIGNNVPSGIYSVRITSAATGYTVWTQISNDADPGNYVWEPRGIAVNQNTNSPFYGRVFVSNSSANPGGIILPGDAVGILKINADGSFADDGGFSTGGYSWAGDFFSPWKMEISTDDKLYVNDWTGNGIILAFDQVISTSYLTVLRDDNNPNGVANMTGPFITGAGTNTKVFMADINYTTPAAGTGITRWGVGVGGTCAPSDVGTKVVQSLFGSDLNLYPYDVAVDKNGKIYTIQFRANAGDSAYRVMRFPAYDEEVGLPATVADWKVGSGDDTLRRAFGIAVDPTATYAAVALRGAVANDGGIALFNADTGELLVRDMAPLEDHRDVAWDNVGNLYAADNAASYLRVYSPPGTNQATTVALPTISVIDSLTLSAPGWSAGQFQFTLNGQASQTYIIQSSTNLIAWNPVATNSDPTAVRIINLPAPDSKSFYRAVVGP